LSWGRTGNRFWKAVVLRKVVPSRLLVCLTVIVNVNIYWLWLYLFFVKIILFSTTRKKPPFYYFWQQKNHKNNKIIFLVVFLLPKIRNPLFLHLFFDTQMPPKISYFQWEWLIFSSFWPSKAAQILVVWTSTWNPIPVLLRANIRATFFQKTISNDVHTK
jgi:hypothetical protein